MVTHGWLDASIGELVQADPALFGAFAYVLVTSVDSTREVYTMRTGRRILDAYADCRPLGSGLLIPGVRVPAIHDALNLFTGFDEIWCLDRDVGIPKPEAISILSPPGFDDAGPREDVPAWMELAGCRLALGDGFGVNYVARDETLRRALVSAAAMPGAAEG
jgi:hypothetical protein